MNDHIVVKQLGFLVFCAVSIPIVIIDIKTKRIPDILILLGITACAGIALFSSSRSFLTFAANTFTGFFFFFALWFFTKGKIGLGDAKYGAFLCGVLGLFGWMAALFLASLLALLFSGVMRLTRKIEITRRIAFAPFLAAGGIFSWFLLPLLSRSIGI